LNAKHRQRDVWYLTRWCLAVSMLCILGCRQDMHDQPRYEPLEASTFFVDGSSARTPVTGTVARGQLPPDTYFFTGKVDGQLGNALPFPLTRQLLERGQERYNIYCVPCHDRVGTGQGMIVRRGLRQPPSFHSARLREVPLAHYFDVMSNGFGAMMDYAVQLKPRDRWAIAAYIRALQLSRQASLDDVPETTRQQLQDKQP
jgi:mono/diheme cytochrome c family protein